MTSNPFLALRTAFAGATAGAIAVATAVSFLLGWGVPRHGVRPHAKPSFRQLLHQLISPFTCLSVIKFNNPITKKIKESSRMRVFELLTVLDKQHILYEI